MQVGEQALNIGRNAVLAAGYPESVPATTIDRQCGSSQQALHFAAQGVIAGAYDVVIAAGVEHMTHTPMGSSVVRDLGFPFGPKMMGRYAERGGLVSPGHLRRDDRRPVGHSRVRTSTRFGARSQQYAARATAEGRFEREIVPVAVPRRRGRRRPTRSSPPTRGPSRHHRRGPGQPEARLQARREGHGRQLLADHRRRRRRAHHERGEGAGPGPHAPGPVPRLRPRRGGPRHHAHRTDPRHPVGAREGQDVDRRHRPRRDQRGLRLGRAGVGEGAARPTWTA